MTTEQSDWLDDERAGRHKPPAFRAAPAGWFTFGTHAGSDLIGVKLEFSSELDEGGDPLWERVVQPEMHTDEEWALIRDEANGIRAWGMSGIPEIMFGDPSDEQLAAAQKRSGGNGVLIIPEAVRDQLFGSEPSMIASAGWCYPSGQVYDFLPTDAEVKAAKRERRKAKKARRRAKSTVTVKRGGIQFTGDLTTMAEEPIENRLRRAWLNGFRDGVDRASYAATESTGRWDY